jgi:hypothetical protein
VARRAIKYRNTGVGISTAELEDSNPSERNVRAGEAYTV